MKPREWAAAWALARHELALARRTLALWAAPALYPGVGRQHGLRRYGDPTALAVAEPPLVPSGATQLAADVVPLLWGPETADSGARTALEGLVPGAAGRRAGLLLYAPLVRSQVPYPPAVGVVRALTRLSARSGCGLLAALRALDAAGRLSAATVAQAVAHAEGGLR